jgi:hypothetical protein
MQKMEISEDFGNLNYEESLRVSDRGNKGKNARF